MPAHAIVIGLARKAAALVPLAEYAGTPAMSLGRPLTLIGSGEVAHLRLQSRSVDRVHAVVLNADGRVLIRDLGTRNHLLVNDELVREARLNDGDTVRIGKVLFRYTGGSGHDVAGSAEAVAPAMLVGEEAMRPVAVCDPVMLIGSYGGADLVLAGEHVSETHALIVTFGGRRLLRDLGSATGTRVNGQSARQVELCDGHELCIGAHVLSFVLGRALPAAPEANLPMRLDLHRQAIAGLIALESHSRSGNGQHDEPETAAEAAHGDGEAAALEPVVDQESVPDFDLPPPLPLEDLSALASAEPEVSAAMDESVAPTKPAPELLNAAAEAVSPVEEDVVNTSAVPVHEEPPVTGEEQAGSGPALAGAEEPALHAPDAESAALAEPLEDIAITPWDLAAVAEPAGVGGSGDQAAEEPSGNDVDERAPAVVGETSVADVAADAPALEERRELQDAPVSSPLAETKASGPEAAPPVTLPAAPAAAGGADATAARESAAAAPSTPGGDAGAAVSPTVAPPVEPRKRVDAPAPSSRKSPTMNWGPLVRAIIAEQEPDLPAAPVASEEPAPRPKRSTWRWVLGIALVLVVLAGAGAVAAWRLGHWKPHWPHI